MRQPNPVLQNNFIKGLITENTELAFPENACTEVFDCVFNPLGSVFRRKGFDFESGYVTTNTPVTLANEVFTEFLWTAVGGDGNVTFFVQQQGNNLFFYDLSTSISISSNKTSFSVDLTTLVPSGSGLVPGLYPCQYASGRGDLIVVNRACNPFYVSYSTTTGTITTTSFTIQARDFTGLDDGLAVNERPTGTVAALQVSNPAHYYNLLNQGWSENTGSALTAWDTARTDLPSNADYIALYRSSPTVNFDNARVIAQDPLNSPAAKGHFILEATNPDRNTAMSDDGFGGASVTAPPVLIDRTTGVIFTGGSSAPSNATAAFDGVTSINSGMSSNVLLWTDPTSRVGKNYSGFASQITQAKVYGYSDIGFTGTVGTSITYTLMASQTLPASNTNGTTLGSLTITDVADESGGQAITSSDQTTFWNYVWVYQNRPAGILNPSYLAELEFYSPGVVTGSIPTTVERPTTTCFYAGRLFYAGINALSLNNTIFFTQVLQQRSQYGQCYQVNDPTNENLFNLLPSDGGTVVIPEMASVRKLFTYQNALLVFASNGIWLVTGGFSGGFGGGFAANDYFVKKLSSVGTNSPLSIVDRRGIPMWWGEDGIYTIQYDPNFNSFNVVNTTFKTIRSFYLEIPFANKQYVKSAYDPVYDVAYWLYSTDSSPGYSYNSILTLNGISTAYSPWTIGESDPIVRGATSVQDAARNNLPTIKYTTTYTTGADDVLLFSEVTNSSYKDWVAYSNLVNDSSKQINYTSYFITGYHVESKGQTYIESPYVWVFLESTNDSAGDLQLEDGLSYVLLEDSTKIQLEGISTPSCFVQGIFDFTTSGNSGKWSSKQQCYNELVNTNRSLNFRRLKVRGRGHGIQLKFTSSSGSPFQIQGWSVLESIAGTP